MTDPQPPVFGCTYAWCTAQSHDPERRPDGALVITHEASVEPVTLSCGLPVAPYLFADTIVTEPEAGRVLVDHAGPFACFAEVMTEVALTAADCDALASVFTAAAAQLRGLA